MTPQLLFLLFHFQQGILYLVNNLLTLYFDFSSALLDKQENVNHTSGGCFAFCMPKIRGFSYCRCAVAYFILLLLIVLKFIP